MYLYSDVIEVAVTRTNGSSDCSLVLSPSRQTQCTSAWRDTLATAWLDLLQHSVSRKISCNPYRSWRNIIDHIVSGLLIIQVFIDQCGDIIYHITRGLFMAKHNSSHRKWHINYTSMIYRAWRSPFSYLKRTGGKGGRMNPELKPKWEMQNPCQ